jgi:hypothetical protein
VGILSVEKKKGGVKKLVNILRILHLPAGMYEL